ncbi:hypothetical protein GCM10009785_13370 [Brooklawnia cerclae]
MLYLNQEDSDRWPPEMVISVQSATLRMLQLLYVREVYQLSTQTRLPGLDPAPSEHAAAPQGWRSDRWETEWSAALAELVRGERSRAAGTPSRQGIFDALHPRASDRDIDSQLGISFQKWQQRTHRHPSGPFRTSPDYLALDDLIAAWSNGFTTCVMLPLAGEYATRLGRHILLVSPTTRHSPDSYRDALRVLFA